MWRFNNRKPVKTKRSWTESETRILASTCLIEEPEDDANDIASRLLKLQLIEGRTQQAIETRISLIRRAANGEGGAYEIPQQVRDVVRGMVEPEGDQFAEYAEAESAPPADDVAYAEASNKARKVAIGLKLAALTLRQLSTVIEQLIDDLEENNVTKS
jgi:hypothetical protein